MCGNMEDLISRTVMKRYIDSQRGRVFYGCTIGDAMKTIVDEVPSSTRKERKWRRVFVRGWITPRYKCPECEEIRTSKSNYCPTCGVRFVGDER